MAKQLAFYFNADACTDCKACMAACKDKNDLPVGVNWRRVYKYGGGQWLPHPEHPGVWVPSNVYSYALSISCMHCGEPLCTEICPAGAIEKRSDGAVVINGDDCIGCRYCEWACPYGGPQYNEETDTMTKCDFCVDLLAKGENPACVDACVMRALDFGEMDELRAKYGDVRAIEPLPKEDVTQPCMIISPHRHAQFSGNGTGVIANTPEEV
jgi:anaerobic dimethyl sulfoxide reductase subunit B (iron-sulfur subunit)